MIDFYEKRDFGRVVFVTENGKISEWVLSDLCEEYADRTTTPKGNGPRYHVRGNELWTWGPGGNNPALVLAFETQKEADHALLLSFLYDLHERADTPMYFYSREEAEKNLADIYD